MRGFAPSDYSNCGAPISERTQLTPGPVKPSRRTVSLRNGSRLPQPRIQWVTSGRCNIPAARAAHDSKRSRRAAYCLRLAERLNFLNCPAHRLTNDWIGIAERLV